ncbi:MAG: N-formylglutamate amidohydrolase [Hyphomonadaceae bacterium]
MQGWPDSLEAAYDGEAAPAGEAPYTLIEPLRRSTPLVFASPHSGRRYPEDMLAHAQVGLDSLRRAEDAFVDELFSGAAKHGAVVLCAAVARAYVDVNRDPDELDPDMFDAPIPEGLAPASARVQAGFGAIPRVAGDGRPIYRAKLSAAEAGRRIAAVHRPYHTALSTLLAGARARFGCAVLIDCHSMPSAARGPLAPDIVLGDRYGVSCHAAITALAQATLTKLGYRVARNAPFAGGHSTQIYGQPAVRQHALQIEINRGLYLDENTLRPGPGFARLHADMARLTEVLATAEFNTTLR